LKNNRPTLRTLKHVVKFQEMAAPQLKPLWKDYKYMMHQPYAINWMIERETNGVALNEQTIKGGVLSDVNGLGKRHEMLSLIINRPTPLTLIVAPLSRCDYWIQLMKDADIAIMRLNHENYWECISFGTNSIVHITNTDKLRTRHILKETTWDRVIFDEAHLLRNPKSQTFINASQMNATSKWAITSKPITNTLDDLCSLFAIIGINIKPPFIWHRYMKRWVSLLILRRTLAALRNHPNSLVPPVPIQMDAVCECPPEEKALFDKMKPINEMCKLGSGNPSKLAALNEIVSLNNRNKRFVIYSHCTEEMLTIREQLIKTFNSKIEVYSYKKHMEYAAEIINTASQSKAEIVCLIINATDYDSRLKLLGFGNIIYTHPWYNSQEYEQTKGLVVCIGQTEFVNIYRIMVKPEYKLFKKHIKALLPKYCTQLFTEWVEKYANDIVIN
jgi:hypothetical protein